MQHSKLYQLFMSMFLEFNEMEVWVKEDVGGKVSDPHKQLNYVLIDKKPVVAHWLLSVAYFHHGKEEGKASLMGKQS